MRDSILRLQHCFLIKELSLGLGSVCLLLTGGRLDLPGGHDVAAILEGLRRGSLLGWLGTRLAQRSLNYLNIV